MAAVGGPLVRDRSGAMAAVIGAPSGVAAAVNPSARQLGWVLAGTPRIIVVMGVSGAGKTTVGKALAQRLGWVFQEGDSLHPAANIAKMKSGAPLTDADRAPWLEAIGAWIDARIAAGQSAVISCSALKRAYRETLTRGRPQVNIVYLNGSRALIAKRIATRQHPYMPSSLLGSQFADLERPKPDEGVLTVAIDRSVEDQVKEIVEKLGLCA
ncbi:MAG: gluconokinase [Caulobacteraceae bacterium]